MTRQPGAERIELESGFFSQYDVLNTDETYTGHVYLHLMRILMET